MTSFSAVRPQPPTVTHRILDRRLMVGWLGLGTVMYLVSAGLVRLFDELSVRAQVAQLREQAGPLYAVTCEGCTSTGGLVYAWLTDWRALVLWSLVTVVALVTAAVIRKLNA